MCMSSPKIPAPAPMPAPPKPAEALKEVTADQAASRDNTLRRLAQRLSLARTQATSPQGLVNPATTTRKSLLGV